MAAEAVDVVIVGAGAAGLATAIFAGRHAPGRRIAALDGASRLGAKILVSGGGRCNVTNVRVTAGDFWGGSSNVVRRVLEQFTEGQAAAFFREIGVTLHEEEHGKLFPDSNNARTVLDALTREASRLAVSLRPGCRVTAVERQGGAFIVRAGSAELAARCVVLATGGLSLPKTGSDGGGYELARTLGHTLTPTTPGLAPLVLAGDFHRNLSGIAHDVEIAVRVERQPIARIRGALLWTHFGVSGPAAMNASRHWHAAAATGRPVALTLNLVPDHTDQSAEKHFLEMTARQPRTQVRSVVAAMVPARVAGAVLAALPVPGDLVMSQLSREVRRGLVRRLLEWPLPVVASRGYGFAEVTAGGVPLDEIEWRTMESRRCAGLYLVGEILDVDGRIGGFNFQWAWSTGFVAGRALGGALV